MIEALKKFQLDRLADLSALTEFVHLDRPQSAVYKAIGTILAVQFMFVLLSSKGRRMVFTTVDTVLAIILVAILLVAVLSLPIGAIYIGIRGTLLMARSLAETFPAVGRLLRPLLAAIGQRVAGAAEGTPGGLDGAAAASSSSSAAP